MLVVLFALNIKTFASNDKESPTEITVGETYTMTGFFSKWYYSYTATEDGYFGIVSVVTPDFYSDSSFDDEYEISSTTDYVEGGQKHSISVETGKTYYVYFNLTESEATFVASFDGNDTAPQLESVNPEEGSTLDIVDEQNISIKFDLEVDMDNATITLVSGENEEMITTYRFVNNIYTFEVVETVKSWLEEEKIQPEDEVILRIENLKSAAGVAYGEDGTLEIKYKAPALPTKLVSESLPEKFLSYWRTGDEDGVITLTFSSNISAVESVELRYGQVDGDDGIYDETDVEYSINENVITIDLTGKSRSRTDMLPSATGTYDEIDVMLHGITDEAGNHIVTESSGSAGSLTFAIEYMDLMEADTLELDSTYTLEAGYKYYYYVYAAVEEGVLMFTGNTAPECYASATLPENLTTTLDENSGLYSLNMEAGTTYYIHFYAEEEGETITAALDKGSDDTTGINGITIQGEPREGKIYTIGGQLVKEATNKGIYIVNGKKIVVR
ncbi:MAG: hypothetical protein LUC88_07355 [Prevotella sp.]|nr:hypothetical protein [Prevotella sp.]